MFEVEHARLSPRLHNALVADLLQEVDTEEGDQLLLARFLDDREWTEHLGRQLGLRVDGPGGVHDTLMLLIPELDRMLREWPLPTDGKECEALAQAATRSLTPLETYATLLAGPGHWRKTSLTADCTVEKLGNRLRGILRRRLGSSLNDLLGRWTTWDVPRLRDRWQAAKGRQTGELPEMDAADRERALAERRQARRASRADNAKWRAAFFDPPGRTT